MHVSYIFHSISSDECSLDPLLSNHGSGGVIEDKLSYDIILLFIANLYILSVHLDLTESRNGGATPRIPDFLTLSKPCFWGSVSGETHEFYTDMPHTIIFYITTMRTSQ